MGMFKAETVKRLIEEQGRTRKWVAGQCGIEVTSLNHLLSGRREPSRSVLKLLAIALKVPENELSVDAAGKQAAAG